MNKKLESMSQEQLVRLVYRLANYCCANGCKFCVVTKSFCAVPFVPCEEVIVNYALEDDDEAT
jgi:hypothetical protein